MRQDRENSLDTAAVRCRKRPTARAYMLAFSPNRLRLRLAPLERWSRRWAASSELTPVQGHESLQLLGGVHMLGE